MSIDLNYLWGQDPRFRQWVEERVQYGVCQCDVWDLDSFLLHVIIYGLRNLADISDGYPDSFENEEQWQQWLSDMADEFSEALKLSESFSTNDQEAAKAVVKQAFAKLSEHFFDLWD